MHAGPGTAGCFAVRVHLATHPRGVRPATTPAGYGPADLASAYVLNQSGGGTATVALVDAYDDPNAEADLAVYRTQYGLPACTSASGCFQKVNQTGGTSLLPPNAGWAGEESLDIDMVSAICPKCHILLVEATSASLANLYAAEDEAVTLGAHFVSNSWGGSEYSGEVADDVHFNHPGVAITASAGSSGGQYPATSKYVTAVGGTTLTPASNARGWTESAYGSGACSIYEAKATWQTVTTGCTRRADVDVSAVADPSTGVAVYQTYGASGWVVYGGTSVSAPIIAGVYALAGTPGTADYPASYPYAHPGNLFDITTGPGATVGWDGPTGLGTPNGTGGFTAGATPVTVRNPGNQSTVVGTPVNLPLLASGGTPPYVWSAIGLPAGLHINTSTGTITGTPSAIAISIVTVQAKDIFGVAGTTSFRWKVHA